MGLLLGLETVGQCSSVNEGQKASYPARVESVCSARSLQCLYTNIHNMGNKQEDLGIHEQSSGMTWWQLQIHGKTDHMTGIGS